ncbi:hypothetical protein J6590_103756, partial [Homalodisca vitripennis]
VHVQACPSNHFTRRFCIDIILPVCQDKAQVYLSISLEYVLRSISSVHTKGANYNSPLDVLYML